MVGRPDVGLYVWDCVLLCKVLVALSLLAFVVSRHRVMGSVIQMQMGACDHMDFVLRALLDTQVGLAFECRSIL